MRWMACLAVMGCVSFDAGAPEPVPVPQSPPETGGGGDTPTSFAREVFDRDIYPVLQNVCAGCHGEFIDIVLLNNAPHFVQMFDAGTAYEYLLSFSPILGTPPFADDAPILTYHELDPRTDITWYDDTELARVENWLALERSERQP